MNKGGINTDGGRVVVVSNRLPYTLRRAGDAWKVEKSAGGLATAMGPVMRKTEGAWVGWHGDESGVYDARREAEEMSDGTRYRLAFHVPGAPDTDVFSHGDFQTLAAAWASDTSGCRPLGITCGGLPVMGEEDLRRAVERLHAVESECQDNGKIGCAAHVLREMGLE